ncbi:hypothetical protein [Mesobacterium pallidum]|uniref:hypothetical protein n=1 Tax=Mesobacterium pallidum TaxID=2872037 RepID=UPI001EE37D2C|nr:hypothetical protein [Mesobacterium pallidum]
MREAYSDLIAKCVINRKHRFGTFGAEPMIYNAPGGAFGFWRMIEAAGMAPGLIELERDAAPYADQPLRMGCAQTAGLSALAVPCERETLRSDRSLDRAGCAI